MTIPLDALPAEARKKVLEASGRKRGPSVRKFSKDKARTYAIRVLNVVAELSPADRARVLTLAVAMNRV